jgi:negative regulator of sigma E activity
MLRPSWGHRFVSDEITKKDKETGEVVDTEETGVIEKDDQETVLYFDHILPFRTSVWDPRRWLASLFIADKRPDAIKAHVLALANPKDENGVGSIPGLEITEVVPMKRDGGAFIKVRVPYHWVLAEFNQKIHKNIQQQTKHGFANWLQQPTAFPVKGTPWIEDLRRLPNKAIKVKFEGPALSEEELYSLFRRYGTIIDIIPDSNVTTVVFNSFRGAICSKNCITGYKVNGTTLHVQYDRNMRRNAIWEATVNHNRISIPLFIALLAALAVIIFDPIREFFIEIKITNKFTIGKNNPLVKWVSDLTDFTMSHIHYMLGQDDSGPNHRRLWSERLDIVKELKLWIEENVNTFIVVHGPRGSGKHDLVIQHALHNRKDVLYIDCDKLVKSRNDRVFIKNAAQSIGYFPVFPWLNSISGIVDLALQSLTGQKSGLSESKDSQFRNMLSTAAVAIRDISLRGYKPVVHNGSEEITVKEEDYLQQHPEKKPVIVIDRFTAINRSEFNNFVYKELADWAAMLTQMNIARVIFLTEDVGTQRVLSDALPDQVFKYVLLQDASKDTAKSYVLDSLHEDIDVEDTNDSPADLEKKRSVSQQIADLELQLDECLEPIGGRMLDLQAFVRRVRSGEGPQEALSRMVQQTAEQITQIFLNRDQGVTNAQAWELVKMLSNEDHVDYKNFINHPLFKSSPEASLVELEQHGLISMTRDRGVICEIRPAKPIFKAAFKNLLEDTRTANVLETAYLYRLISFETAKIQKWEQELGSLSWFTNKKEFNNRIQYLANKIEVSNQTILDAEAKIKKLKG